MCLAQACGLPVCPFCTGAVGDTFQAVKIGGTALASSVGAGISYKYKTVWIPKVKKIFHKRRE
jgi:hypothetical protein